MLFRERGVTANHQKGGDKEMLIENRSIWQKLTSRKFLLTLLTAVLLVINEELQLVDPETLKYVIGTVVAWILGESYVDAHK